MTAHDKLPEERPASTTRTGTPGPSAGRWYFVVTIASLGLLAWVPFAHAAARLHRPSDKRFAAIYGAATLLILILALVTPTDPVTGEIPEGEPISVVGGLLVLTVIAAACVQQIRLRREVYGGVRHERPPAPPAGYRSSTSSAPSGTDPAVAAVLAARERRDTARELVASDPLMARELRIGRPDLRPDYDDGGLVDLNSAPVSAIAEVCELDTATAERIVDARSARGGFLTVDDVFTAVEVPLGAWEMIRDRAVAVPR